MISIVVGTVLAALSAVLLILGLRFGALRLSELPGLVWVLLAGRDSRRHLRVILTARDRRAAQALARTDEHNRALRADLRTLSEQARAYRETAERGTAALRDAECFTGHAGRGEQPCPECRRRYRVSVTLREPGDGGR